MPSSGVLSEDIHSVLIYINKQIFKKKKMKRQERAEAQQVPSGREMGTPGLGRGERKDPCRAEGDSRSWKTWSFGVGEGRLKSLKSLPPLLSA